ncbi:MAG TPA: hypothetical protein VHQ22_10520, partial [Terriglobales bacterium]|nr:hypothetical protein [Terriglobales bacterium]
MAAEKLLTAEIAEKPQSSQRKRTSIRLVNFSASSCFSQRSLGLKASFAKVAPHSPALTRMVNVLECTILATIRKMPEKSPFTDVPKAI